MFKNTYSLGVLQSKNFDLTSNSISFAFVPGNSIFTCNYNAKNHVTDTNVILASGKHFCVLTLKF